MDYGNCEQCSVAELGNLLLKYLAYPHQVSQLYPYLLLVMPILADHSVLFQTRHC